MGAVLVTGATGQVGREVVRALAALSPGLDLRATRSRDAVQPTEGASAGLEWVALDFRERSTWGPALDGVDRLFLLRPPAISDVGETLCPFINEARRRGVGHIVFLSVAGADKNRWVPHRRVEDHLRRGDDGFTLLRPGFFAQNLATAYREDIIAQRRIYVPAGRGPDKRVNWIDVRDIAEVAARVLLAPEPHRGRAYTLTGPGPVPWSVVTDALSAALGHPIRYEAASILGYARHLHRRGLPVGAIAVQTVLHVLLRFGQVDGSEGPRSAVAGSGGPVKHGPKDTAEAGAGPSDTASPHGRFHNPWWAFAHGDVRARPWTGHLRSFSDARAARSSSSSSNTRPRGATEGSQGGEADPVKAKAPYRSPARPAPPRTIASSLARLRRTMSDASTSGGRPAKVFPVPRGWARGEGGTTR